MATRIVLALLLSLGGTIALAQFSLRRLPPIFIQYNTVYQPAGTQPAFVGPSINTRSIYPQIDDSVTYLSIKPEEKNPPRLNPPGWPNALKPGGIGGTSFASTDARFGGVGFTGAVPPDPNIAAGPLHIVQGVNTRFAFFDKTSGALQFSQDTNQFFSGLGAPSFHSDPRIIYDQFNNRWIMLILALDFNTNISDILIAVSDDSDPNGVWNRFVINSALTINGLVTAFDYPMMGYTKDALVISGNMFDFQALSFQAASVFVVPTGPMYAGSAPTVTSFIFPNDFSIQPALGMSDTDKVFAFEAFNSTTGKVFAVSNLLGAPAITSTNIAIPAWSPMFQPAPSGSGGGGLDTLSPRMMDACFRDGFMVAAHTIKSSDGTRSAVRWYEINLGTWPATGAPTLAQTGNIELPSGQWAILPAISKNALGDISIIYTRSSNSIFSDLVISTRTSSDPAGTIGAPIFVRGGLASSNVASGSRWGDYFAAVEDPIDDTTFWGDGEITRADGFWNTEITSWVVSTGGGGGGGGGVDYDPVTVAPLTGSYVAGTAADLASADNVFYDMDSVFEPGLGHYAAIQADFAINEQPADITQLLFTLEGNIDPGVTATGTVFLWNWNSGKYEYGKAFALHVTGDDPQTVKLKTDLAKYVSPTGDVRVLFRAHDPIHRRGSSSSPFRMRTDEIKLNVKV